MSEDTAQPSDVATLVRNTQIPCHQGSPVCPCVKCRESNPKLVISLYVFFSFVEDEKTSVF